MNKKRKQEAVLVTGGKGLPSTTSRNKKGVLVTGGKGLPSTTPRSKKGVLVTGGKGLPSTTPRNKKGVLVTGGKGLPSTTPRNKKGVLVTGGAGFIGSATVKALMDRGDRVVMIDNFNDYYDPNLKEDRLKILLKGYKKSAKNPNGYVLYRGDIRDEKILEKIFKKEKIDKVVHLAAMAGVRYSLTNPGLYVDVNIVATTKLLDLAVKYKVKNFVYASSSSVYGANAKVPFSETDPVDIPISPYAATKKADELIAHVYSHIYKLPTTGLRFFTVYGPWGRPDMGVFKFVDWIIRGQTIELFNGGDMRRNFTYIDDIVSGILVAVDTPLPYSVMNIGGDKDEHLLDYVEAVEKYSGKIAKKKMLPMQPGDVPSTVADITKLRSLGWKPTTRIDQGVKNFVEWYREYYGRD
jgi:UDP-glucuronate 4-epimerase